MPRRRRKRIKRMWTTRQGKSIPISEMSDRHILNSIKLFEKSEEREIAIGWLKEERDKRLKKIADEPIKNRWSILDLRKDEDDE